MKKFLTLTLVAVLLSALMLTLASCSSYGKIEKNFLNADYELVDTTGEDGEDLLEFVANLEEGEASCTVHILKKDLVSYAIILEFGADKDAQAKLDELLTDEDVKNFMKLDDEAQFIRGNCVLVPFTLNIFNLQGTVEEMAELFNK